MANLNGYTEDNGGVEFGRRDVFSILAILALLAFMLVVSTGCGATIQVKNSSEYEISLEVNGSSQTFEFPDGRQAKTLKTSESVALKIPTMNLGSYVGMSGSYSNGYHPTEVMLVASAWQRTGGKPEFVGTTTNKFWLYSDREQHFWIITNDDFRERYGWTHSNGAFLGIFR